MQQHPLQFQQYHSHQSSQQPTFYLYHVSLSAFSGGGSNMGLGGIGTAFSGNSTSNAQSPNTCPLIATNTTSTINFTCKSPGSREVAPGHSSQLVRSVSRGNCGCCAGSNSSLTYCSLECGLRKPDQKLQYQHQPLVVNRSPEQATGRMVDPNGGASSQRRPEGKDGTLRDVIREGRFDSLGARLGERASEIKAALVKSKFRQDGMDDDPYGGVYGVE
ncbi:unnamed protein product [Protopolystoma xenopodis]|uniref:Uncharacterized protein n=1 Tax=Protopolystoma xenopodis TaxID=117903 RepID=A0A3S4ZBM1_9PLAT|nr:unnamed protein product [Protopolystoma xenopodis]